MFFKRGKRLLVVSTMTALLLSGGVGATPAMSQMVTGSISGTVYEAATGLPRQVCIAVHNVSPGAFLLAKFFFTNPDGTYLVTELPAGEYQVRFGGPCHLGGAAELAREWYNNRTDQATADHVVVLEGRETSGVDAVLSDPGTISGTVFDENRQPISGICVMISEATVPSPTVGSYADLLLGAITDSQGRYSESGLGHTTYKLHFNAIAEFGECRPKVLYDSPWFRGRDSFQLADSVTPAFGGAAANVNARLAFLSIDDGNVNDHDDGQGNDLDK